MQVIKSNVILDEGYKPMLVTESCVNYESIETINKPEDVVEIMRYLFHLDIQAEEYLYLIAMTTKNTPISFFEVSHGTHKSSLAEPREFLIRALLCGASNYILVHNHPSGQSEPSPEDIKVTEQMYLASNLIGISLCDHIIIGRDNFYSFRQNGIILK